jgi:hypothetical protein
MIEIAERFAAAARDYLAQAAHQPAAAQAARDFSNFLRDQSMALFQFPWNADLCNPGAAAPWQAMQDAPALGLTREHQQRWQRTADAVLRLASAQRRLQSLWSDALRDAATAFAAEIAAGGGRPAPGGATLRGFYNSWIECAERAYSDMAHSETFCSALAEFVNAGSNWRREFAADVEHWLKLMDLPTRSEINSLNVRLKSIEEQLLAVGRKAAHKAAGQRPAVHAARSPRARVKRARKS